MNSIRNIARWYFSRGALPYWSILILDCLFVVFSGLLAYTVHHGSEATFRVFPPLVLTLGVFLLCFIVGFRIFHTYQGVMRFSSFTDLMRVSTAVITAIVLVFIVQWAFASADWLVAFSTADVILMALFVIALMWTVRIWVKTLYEDSIHRADLSRTFILGVREGGVALAKNIRSSSESPYKVVGLSLIHI